MRALPKTLILSLSVGLTLATAVPVALADGLGNVEKMPGSGAMEPGVMGEMGTGMMVDHLPMILLSAGLVLAVGLAARYFRRRRSTVRGHRSAARP